jgi:hypothetical protein
LFYVWIFSTQIYSPRIVVLEEVFGEFLCSNTLFLPNSVSLIGLIFFKEPRLVLVLIEEGFVVLILEFFSVLLVSIIDLIFVTGIKVAALLSLLKCLELFEALECLVSCLGVHETISTSICVHVVILVVSIVAVALVPTSSTTVLVPASTVVFITSAVILTSVSVAVSTILFSTLTALLATS